MWLISLAWECCSATAQFSGVFKCHNYLAYSLLGSVPFKSASAISLVSNLLRRGVEQESHLVFSLSKIKVMLWVEGSNYGNCARNFCIVLSIFFPPPPFANCLATVGDLSTDFRTSRPCEQYPSFGRRGADCTLPFRNSSHKDKTGVCQCHVVLQFILLLSVF